MSFNGTAIYIFFILANNLGPGIVTKTAANFTLDHEPPVLFEHIPDMSQQDILYNQMVFARTNIENINHSLVISVSGAQEQVWVSFDRAIYTHEDIVPLATSSITHSGNPTDGLLTDSVTITEGIPPVEMSTQLVIPPAEILTQVGTTTSGQPTDSMTATVNTPIQQTAGLSTHTGTIVPAGAPANINKGSTPAGPIAGGIGACLVIITLSALSFILIRRRKQRINHGQDGRQQELEQRLQALQQGVKELLKDRNGQGQGHSRISCDEVEDMVREMHAQVGYLPQGRESALALRSSDESPPEYSTIL